MLYGFHFDSKILFPHSKSFALSKHFSLSQVKNLNRIYQLNTSMNFTALNVHSLGQSRTLAERRNVTDLLKTLSALVHW